MRSIVRKGKSAAARVDWLFVAAIGFLIILGLTIQYSISVNQDGETLSTFYKQLTFAAIGIAFFVTLSSIDYRIFKFKAIVTYTIAAVLLLSVLLLGTEIKGTTGWFIIGPFSLQPVEFVKILFILWIGMTFREDATPKERLRFFFVSGIATAVLIALILKQPDLGSSLIIFFIWFSTILFLRAPKWFVGLVVSAVVTASTLGWFFFFKDYQKSRLATFIDPNVDPLGTGYNITQSIVAVGSGGLWGRGLGLGTQSQLHFLPESASDFVFAVIAEELGFIGVVAVVGAIGFILWKLWTYIQRTRDPFAFIFLFGTLSYLLMQSFLVIGMNIGIMPITGLPLPLISAGGSSFMATMILLGICHRIGTSQQVNPHTNANENL